MNTNLPGALFALFERVGLFVGCGGGGLVSTTFSRALILLCWSFNSSSTLKNPAQYKMIDKTERMVAKEGILCF